MKIVRVESAATRGSEERKR